MVRKTYGWGFMMLRFRDQDRVAHLLLGDGSPACGAHYYASCGAAETELLETQKCWRCQRLRAA